MYDVTTAKLFLLDMDGTFYLDDTLLPGALEFLALCRATGRQFAFLTNNSSKSKADYLAKLTRLGADVTEHDIFTSGDATLLYLAENGFSKDILLIGTPSLEAQFAAEGYTVRAAKPRAVVLGFDTTITYNKLRLLCDAVRAGLPYIATHPDYNCPVAGGFIPDIGARLCKSKHRAGPGCRHREAKCLHRPRRCTQIRRFSGRRMHGGRPPLHRYCTGRLRLRHRAGAVR